MQIIAVHNLWESLHIDLTTKRSPVWSQGGDTNHLWGNWSKQSAQSNMKSCLLWRSFMNKPKATVYGSLKQSTSDLWSRCISACHVLLIWFLSDCTSLLLSSVSSVHQEPRRPIFLPPRAKRVCEMCKNEIINMHVFFLIVIISNWAENIRSKKKPLGNVYLLMCHQMPPNSLYCTQKHYELPCAHRNVSVLNIHDRRASLDSWVVAFYGAFPFLLKRSAGVITDRSTCAGTVEFCFATLPSSFSFKLWNIYLRIFCLRF